MILLEKVFLLEEIRINTTIAVLLAYILSPKITMIEKQHGQVEQIKWLFFKKVLKN